MWSWTSPLWPVWFWHALFDGTRLCPCSRSRKWREAIAAEYRVTGPGE